MNYGNRIPTGFELKVVIREAVVGNNGEWRITFPEVCLVDVLGIQETPVYNTYDQAKTPTGVNVVFYDNDQAEGTALKGTSLGLLVGTANLWAEPGTKIQAQILGF